MPRVKLRKALEHSAGRRRGGPASRLPDLCTGSQHFRMPRQHTPDRCKPAGVSSIPNLPAPSATAALCVTQNNSFSFHLPSDVTLQVLQVPDRLCFTFSCHPCLSGLQHLS